MTLIKLGRAEISSSNIQSLDSLNDDFDLNIHNRMKKIAEELKVIAPKADDFLYFTCVMMHAAEASLIDDDGNIRKQADGSPITVKWEPVGEDSVRWVCSDPNVMPYRNSNCFIPGTKITLSDGTVKNIEEIEVGDEVLTHLGNTKKVLAVMVNDYDSDILKISQRNGLDIFCTNNHPFYRLKVTHPQKSNDSQKHLLRQGHTKKEFEFVEAKDLNRGDLLTIPVIKSNCPNEFTPGQARLLGLFAAEGSYSKKYNKYQGLCFTLNINEKDSLAPYINNLFAQEFPDASVHINERPDCSVCSVTVTGKGIVDFFRSNIGEYSQHKTLSPQLVFNNSDEIKLNFITGWFEGDGHISKDFGVGIGITVSENMASQISLMLHSLNIHHSVRFNDLTGIKREISEKYGSYNISSVYRIEIPSTYSDQIVKNSNFLTFNNKPSTKPQSTYYDNYFLKTISGIEEIEYKGKVYNFEVEDDHSYIANGLAVHNCDIFPEFELKQAHRKWVGKPLCVDHQSQNAEAVRGCIVDTVYDDKRKRVIALCALDKKNHPKLAHNVASAISTDVSMGTAVGRAVCTEVGCHRVARVESDFCEHMRSKNCYGEINLDLNPMELSIVFSGADRKAKVKHIIAKDLSQAADSLSDYVDGKISTGNVSKEDLVKLQKELADLTDRVKKLADSVSDDENNTNYGMTGSSPTMQEVDWSALHVSPNPPQTDVGIISNAVLGIQQKVANLQAGYDKLYNMVKSSEEPNMTKKQAYMQGTEEPNRGGTTYKPDPANEAARSQDKHMVGAPPFPNTGGNSGSYPGDEAKKKELQRAAEMEERRAKRAEALAKAKDQIKKAYPQGTEEANVGGTTYKPDPGNEAARQQDKQMVGKAPFPGVGDINGLYGDDMKIKEMLARANWKVKFRKVSSLDGSIDKGTSRWDIYAVIDNKEKLMHSASVNDITGGRADHLYDGVATEAFGKGLISRLKSEGFLKTKEVLMKSAQPAAAGVAPGMPAGAPPAPAGDMGGAASAPAGDLDVPDSDGSEEDKVKSLVSELKSLHREMSEVTSDLEEALGGVEEEAAGLEGVEPLPEEKFAEIEDREELRTFANYKGMQKTLNMQLSEGLAEAVSDLRAHASEIAKTQELYESRYSEMSGKQKGQLNLLAAEAVTDAKAVLAESVRLIGAVVKYAHGTAQLEKVAEGFSAPVPEPVPAPVPEDKKSDLLSANDGKSKEDKEDKEDKENKDEDKKDDKDKDDKKDDKEDEDDASAADDNNAEGDPLAWFNPEAYAKIVEEERERDPLLGLDGEMLVDDNEAAVTFEVDPNKIKLESGEIIDLQTKEGRAMYRTKLAQQGVNWSDMPGTAHPSGSQEPKLDVKPSDKDAKFHTLQDTHDKVMNVATAPVKVKKQAEKINNLVTSGQLAVEDVDSLEKHGVDKDAIKYWKQYYSEAKDPKANEFAAKLTQEHANQKKAEDEIAFKAKVKRAYQLANSMVNKGIVEESQLDKQAEEILAWDDASFESVKKIISKQASVVKQASLPQVGQLESGDIVLPSAQPMNSSSAQTELKAAYSQLFSSGKKTPQW